MCKATRVDIDAYSGARRDQWHRLDELVKKRRLSGAEIEELIELYRQTGADLSLLAASGAQAQHSFRLASLVGRARAKIAGTATLGWNPIWVFFTRSLPYAMYRLRWSTLIFGLLFVLVALACGRWVYLNPQVMHLLGSEDQLREMAEESFEAYYSDLPATTFGPLVWTNNAKLALNAVVSGITGILPVGMLMYNAINVGQVGAIMFHCGAGGKFFALILPHGLLELSSLFFATAAGWQLFWTVLNPGRRSRARALAQEGRQLLIVCVSLVVMLAAAGALESLVTPSNLLWWEKIAVGFVVWAVFVLYAGVLGRRCQRLGYSADISTDEAGYTLEEVA